MSFNNNKGGFKQGGFGGSHGGKFGGSKFGGHGGGFGGGKSFGGGSKFGGRDRGEQVMHEAICASCHKNCQVPFRPTNDRPVYCRDCFNKNGGAASKPSFDGAPRKDFGFKPHNEGGFKSESRPDFKSVVNGGFKPQADNSFAPNKGNEEIKKQLEALNVKIDSLIRTVEMLKNPAQEGIEKGAKNSGKNAFAAKSIAKPEDKPVIVEVDKKLNAIVVKSKAKKVVTKAKKGKK